MAGGATLNHLATMLAADADGAEVRLRTVVRPIAPQRWHCALYPERKSKSMGAIVGEALLDTIFQREYGSAEPKPVELSDDEREARRRKRAARSGFEVGLVIEVAGTDAASGRALLHRLKSFTSLLGEGLQSIEWRVRDGAVDRPPRFWLGDWELAQLWYLPDAGFDQAGLPRHRPLVAPPPRIAAGNGAALTIGESRDGPLRLPLDALARHMAVIGATGSGKSTLLMSLALGVLETPIGATVIDPHGDLAADVDEVPTFDTRALEKIHDEGRKFGLLLVTAAQSLSGLGVRLRDSVLANAGVLALLSPGADDVQALRRLVTPLSAEDLLGMRQHEMVIRMTGPDGRAGVFGGMVCPPPPGDSRVAEALIRASDARDARPLEQVEAEVRRRAGGVVPAADGAPRPGPADPK